jgi:5-methyltetrahydrofolate--homocysteine methyltransferase
MDILREIGEFLQQGDEDQVRALTERALGQGLPAKKVLDEGLVSGMNVVGEKFKRHEIFLPDVLLAARAMYAGLDLLRPILSGQGAPSLGKVVIGTVQGDLHDIGKNLVGIMLRGAGFEVIDLGHDVPPEKFVETAEREGANVIGLSALLTTTMVGMSRVVALARKSSRADAIKVIVGGAPVSEEFAREIGADAHGYDAASAVERVRALVAAR